MVGNFDCTQFITFDSSASEEKLNNMLSSFQALGFIVISGDEVKPIKRQYFKDYSARYFIELKFDNFMGEFEDWEQLDKPPILINQFIETAYKMVDSEGISNIKIILTSFAEEERTTNEVMVVEKSHIREGLYIMSKHNFEVWVDNLILEILK
ncbi:hypothetical protein [Anaerosacchariphilus polymeriproducens]|uniref:Uncharacterized protein n=1 Tax=Anaerosacchariphilus polymeriproducens TaxID=1812858 RepID=A0A371ASY8_9FIRM|nr:hypothetical protein [Anaerosacchariphilus polymeriproducens]RDU22652.1 hypothetical protein DWV06_15390 [Anaerosacchariphilus polymeriproducens]